MDGSYLQYIMLEIFKVNIIILRVKQQIYSSPVNIQTFFYNARFVAVCVIKTERNPPELLLRFKMFCLFAKNCIYHYLSNESRVKVRFVNKLNTVRNLVGNRQWPVCAIFNEKFRKVQHLPVPHFFAFSLSRNM